MRTFVKSILAVIAVCAAGTVLAIMFATNAQIRSLVEWGSSRMLDREVSIKTLSVDRGRITTIGAANITIANLPWAGEEPLVEIENLEVAVDIWSVFSANLDIYYIYVDGAVVRPTIATDGQSNLLQPSNAVSSSADRASAPIVRAVSLTDLRVVYGIANQNGVDVLHEVAILEGRGAAASEKPASFEANGTYLGEALSVAVSGEPFARLIAREAPYVFTAEVAGAFDAALSGVIGADGNFEKLNLRLDGPTLAVLDPFVPPPIPDTPPFSISGDLFLGKGIYGITNLQGTVGDSDVGGEAKIDFSGERPLLTADFRSNFLDLDDLAGLIGAVPDPTETANESQQQDAAAQPLVPESAVPVEQLRRADIDIKFIATKVSSPIAQVERVEAIVKLVDGRLVISPLDLGVSGGVVTGEIALNVREDIPSADIDLVMADISFAKFFANSRFAQEMGGAISGKVYFLGVGDTLPSLLGTARGNGHLVLKDGKISALILEGAGVDMAEALGVVIAGDAPVAMPCAVGSVSAEDGIFQINEAIASTADSNLIASGQLNLRDRTISLNVEARAKDFSLLDLDVPVQIVGPIAQPSISLGRLKSFPLFEFGEEEDVGCEVLEDRARSTAPGNAP